jgi:excisionase family DNA binding protein
MLAGLTPTRCPEILKRCAKRSAQTPEEWSVVWPYIKPQLQFADGGTGRRSLRWEEHTAPKRADLSAAPKKPVAQARTLAGKTRMNNSLPKLYDVGEIAQYLRISERTVQRLIASGKLPARKFGRAVRVIDHDLKDFLSEGNSPCDRGKQTGPENSSSSGVVSAASGRSVGMTNAPDRRLVFQLARQTSNKRGPPSSNTR